MLEVLKEKFFYPQDEYTPIPFWFWNDALNEKELERQILDFKSKGVNGFVIHPRIGIPKEIEYLSDRFMELVKFAVELADRNGMKVILYDEAMYPSGSAHGLVVKDNLEYASRGIKMLEFSCSEIIEIATILNKEEKIISVLLIEKNDLGVINHEKTVKIEIIDGKIDFVTFENKNNSVLIFIEGFSLGTIRGIHFGEDDLEPAAPISGDLLNADAMNKFITLTHERYYSVLKQYFGNTVIAMFTDEPVILGRCHLPNMKPWTNNFLEWYIECGNSELDLPALWLDMGENSEAIRRNYRKSINLKLVETYYKPISKWCEDHGICFTGHTEKSDEIGFLKYFHIPGQDIVWRWVAPEDGKGLEGEHSTMAKCSSDAARHYGRQRNSNECFGCCGPNGVQWAFSADDMKWYLDWMFVRGVNLIYPHAFYYSIDGEKRYGERPPDVGPNNIWWKYYNNISDYVKRMCWIMTDSINQARVAILCEEDHLPWAITKPLYQNQIEFNYLEESFLVSEDCSVIDTKLCIAAQVYSAILIEDFGIVSQIGLEKLQKFINAGGLVVVFNSKDVDSVLDGVKIVNQYEQVVEELNKALGTDISFAQGSSDLRVSHVVKNGIHFFILVNEGEFLIQSELKINIYGAIEKWDSWKGEIEELTVVKCSDGKMSLPFKLNRRESIILCIDPTLEPLQAENVGTQLDLRETEMLAKWEIRGLNEKNAFYSDTLETWGNWLGDESFSGTVEYLTTFEFQEVNAFSKVKIALGEVHELAHIYINEVDAGAVLWAPYEVDVTEIIKKGVNTLRIQVTNSVANRLENEKLKSGMIGPIRIRVI